MDCWYEQSREAEKTDQYIQRLLANIEDNITHLERGSNLVLSPSGFDRATLKFSSEEAMAAAERLRDNKAAVDWLGRWRDISLRLYGPLAFIQSWESGPTLSNSDIDRIAPADEQLVTKRIDVAARKNNREYMQLLGDHYQQQQLSQINWGRLLDQNLVLQANIRTLLNESLCRIESVLGLT